MQLCNFQINQYKFLDFGLVAWYTKKFRDFQLWNELQNSRFCDWRTKNLLPIFGVVLKLPIPLIDHPSLYLATHPYTEQHSTYPTLYLHSLATHPIT
jgi:hypothetical protein